MARIFVAVPAPLKLQEEIFKWRQQFKLWPVRWLAGKNLHITLVPPWDEEAISNTIAQLQTLSGRFAKFSLRLNKISFGPNLHQPRLIWAAGPTSPDLTSLASSVQQILNQPSLDRRFLLHMTLGRFREEEFSKIPIINFSEVNWLMPVESIVLMRSHLRPEGADYEVLSEVKF